MSTLAEAAVTVLGVEAAAVLQVSDDDRVAVVAAENLPAELIGWSVEAESIGADLERQLLAVAGGGLAHARGLLLVAGGDLHGVLVLLGAAPVELDAGRSELAGALVDLAAIAASRAADFAALGRSYAELRASREALARSERLRVLGQMAAGVSHDVKNILNPLALQLELVRRRSERGDHAGVVAVLGTMREVIQHGVDVVERLRDFSRQAPEVAAETVDVDAVVATALELSRPRVAQYPGVRLERGVTGAPPVRARSSELTTAVVNLIVNATEAMPGGGTITVTTGEREGGGWIAVADNGPGMPPEVEKQVFEPFFTTKEEGTGLGLPMIYAFVQRQRGRIALDTAPGRGTRVELWFPGHSS